MTSRLLIAALLGLLACGAAQARQIRFPATGTPAVAFELPDDWSNSIDKDDNNQSTAPDKSAFVQYSLLNSPQEVSLSLDELAKRILVAAQAPPFTRRDSSAIDGISGYTYFTASSGNGITANVELTLVKLNDAAVLTTTIVYRSDANASLTQVVEVVKSTKIIRAEK